MKPQETLGLLLLALFFALVAGLFLGGETERGAASRAEAQRTVAEIETRAANARLACRQGVAEACGQ